MKKADTLSEKIASGMAVTATDKSGVDKPGTSGSAGEGNQARGDHIDAINQVFAEMELAYHNQYHKAYAQEGSVNLAKKYWLECLSRFSPETILTATRTIVTTQEYLPTVAAIIQACEDVQAGSGLPSARDAYVEACCAANPKAEQSWSHPAVYLAGKETGWFELANKPEARIFPVFEDHYRRLCHRAQKGEILEIQIPEALPEKHAKKLSQAENKEKMAALRKQLKS